MLAAICLLLSLVWRKEDVYASGGIGLSRKAWDSHYLCENTETLQRTWKGAS